MKRTVFRCGYLCGPTPHRNNHLGNYLTYLRSWKNFKSRKSKDRTEVLIMNLTDVNPKIYDLLKKRDSESLACFVNKKVRVLLRNLRLLGVPPEALEIRRVSAQVDDIVRTVREMYLEGKVVRLPEGYKLARGSSEEELGYLWKFSSEYPMFKGPFPEDPLGIPGWHIECAQMINSFVNSDHMVHYSGVDLKTIHNHNECEILKLLRPQLSIDWVFWQPMLLKDSSSKMSKSSPYGGLQLEEHPKAIPNYIRTYLESRTSKGKTVLDPEVYLKELKASLKRPLNLKRRRNKGLARLIAVRNTLRLRGFFKVATRLKEQIISKYKVKLQDAPLRELRRTNRRSSSKFKIFLEH